MCLRPLLIHAVEYLPSVERSPILCIYPCPACIPPIPLYSLVPISPYCSVANRRVARVASYWLASSVRAGSVRPVRCGPLRPVPPSCSRFGLAFARGPAGRGLIGARRLHAVIWLVRFLVFRQGSVTGAIGNRDTTWNRGKGVYVIIQLYTHWLLFLDESKEISSLGAF